MTIGSTMFERVWQDVRFGWRLLWRSPGFTLVALGTLALAIGATTAMFTVVDGILLRPLRFPAADRLVMVWERAPGRTTPNVVQTQNFLEWRSRSQAFSGMAAILALPMTIAGSAGTGSGETGMGSDSSGGAGGGDAAADASGAGAGAEQVFGLLVTGDFLSVLRVAPALGRDFRAEDDERNAPGVALLSHALWQQRFGANPAVIGRQVSINGAPHTIIGVLPASFSFPQVTAHVYVPMRIDPATAPRDGRNYSVVARLRDGVTMAAAQADMSRLAAQIAQEVPQRNAKWGAMVIPLHEQVTGDLRPLLAVLFGAVVGVLLIACVNLANLQSMRSTTRAREITVRLALGAGQGRVMQQLLIESVLLAAIGGVFGFVLAYAGVPAILALFPANFPLTRADEVHVDARVLAFTGVVSIAAGLVFGLLPAFQARRRSLADALRTSGRSVAGGGARLRGSLVIVEVTLAVVLVIGAGLMIRSLAALSRVDPGFDAERVMTLRMLLLPAKYGSDLTRRAAVVDEMLTRIRALPQVDAASSIHMLPFQGISGTGYSRADRPAPPPGEITGGHVSVVSPDYFRTMRIPLLAGRDFDTRDGPDAPQAVLVNQAMAQQYFPGENPIGKSLRVQWNMRMQTPPPTFEIIGIVGNIRHITLDLEPLPCIFLSNVQQPSLRVSLVVRAAGDPLAIAASVRDAIRSVDADQGISTIEPLTTVLSDSIVRPRLQTLLLGAFGGLALLMACVGLYGVLAYSVEQRRREMGVRLALGAAPTAIRRLIVGEGLRLTIAGVIAGLAAAFLLTRYLATLLYGVRPHDTVVFITVAVTLIGVALAACWLPARRATRVDPMSILREE